MYIYFTGIQALIDQQISLRIRFVSLLTPLLYRDQVNSLIRYICMGVYKLNPNVLIILTDHQQARVVHGKNFINIPTFRHKVG